MKLGSLALKNALASGSLRAYRGERVLGEKDLIIGPNSIDVTLHPTLLIPKWLRPIDPRQPATEEEMWNRRTIDSVHELQPGHFVLGAASERFACDPSAAFSFFPFSKIGIAQMYEGRSTCARLGIESHLSAGFGDVGFSGAFTLEIVNNSPNSVYLFPGMRIGQVAFEVVIGVESVYTGKYSGKDHYDGPVAPVLGPDRF